ncbi:hypothetical protein OE88DRAFT_103858 [Heliocybe sulcata]|uniref:Uncharacterized protein n=1 Tax=Heliocybe sulcata TaxID=5364 RepID=A0A5C3NIT1_9AGAM|nr:hypothetical protein OE88DRAFT_103858 [Heliocybe sulcata]
MFIVVKPTRAPTTGMVTMSSGSHAILQADHVPFTPQFLIVIIENIVQLRASPRLTPVISLFAVRRPYCFIFIPCLNCSVYIRYLLSPLSFRLIVLLSTCLQLALEGHYKSSLLYELRHRIKTRLHSLSFRHWFWSYIYTNADRPVKPRIIFDITPDSAA